MDGGRLGAAAGAALLLAAGALAWGALRPVGGGGDAGQVATSVPAAAPGAEVVADGARFAIGRPGDLVVVADWMCSQRPTAAVLRPSTGGLFVFDRWAGPGGIERAVRVLAEPGATTLAAGATCGRADLGHADGTHHLVATIPAPPPLSATSAGQGAHP